MKLLPVIDICYHKNFQASLTTILTHRDCVSIWMNNDEYKYLKAKIKELGISQQAFIISAVYDAKVISSIEIAVLINISRTFADLERQLRGLASNVNQIAHIANKIGMIPSLIELETISTQIEYYRKESEKQWQSIRSLISQQRVTGQ